MPRICFLGAGSTVFAKSVLGDIMLHEDLQELEFSLHDIDPVRLEDSRLMLTTIAKNLGKDVQINASLNRREALVGSDYLVNAVQIGGYDPCTLTDFAIPKKYQLQQTIADTLGIGGIFRGLRTIPVMEEFAADIEDICPDALLLNYTNPMSILTGYMLRYTGVKTLGLCHSVQGCARELLNPLGMEDTLPGAKWYIAGINHQAWLLEIRDKDGNDLYPEIKKRAFAFLDGLSDIGNPKDKVRYELMRQFGYYITESSEHNAEYTPWFIKRNYPELISRYNIPIDEYLRRCVRQIESWQKMRAEIVENGNLIHTRTSEYAASIIAAIETDKAFRVHGNVLNTGLIPNLPANSCVEVPCLIDRNGVNPCYVGDLPEQCAALNRTNINVHLLTIQAAHTRRKEDVYRAALMDPHTAAELSIDDIRSMCDDLFEAHGSWLPKYV
ncbi:MAG: alpha-glucosidase/alpha-galactosidase [Symbiobacteriaceae bacterium]|nr:alpha-glucosidase/alpha-galactosidase [Symbiobacteriaceae bacterium]